MSTFQAISLMLMFGTFTLNIVTLVVAVVKQSKK
ncbi:putative holin-like toxin [Apilactobacillus micheneri]|nr:putative holin-like toxin [Apilactobacillus micheneri]